MCHGGLLADGAAAAFTLVLYLNLHFVSGRSQLGFVSPNRQQDSHLTFSILRGLIVKLRSPRPLALVSVAASKTNSRTGSDGIPQHVHVLIINLANGPQPERQVVSFYHLGALQ